MKAKVANLYEIGRQWTESVTPARARQLLDGQHMNRLESERIVNVYAKDMKAGNWTNSPIPVLVDEQGRMFDGQHRMAALIKANTTLQFNFAVSRYEDVMLSLDTGKKRTFADTLKITGMKLASETASTVRTYQVLMQYQEKRGFPRLEETSQAERWNTYHSIDADVWRSAALLKGRAGLRQIKFSTAASGCHVAFALIDRQRADLFLDKMSTGVGLEEGDPILAVRKLAARMANDPSRSFAMRTKLFIIVRAWNAWIEGEDLRAIHVAGKDFPKINKPI